MGFPNCCLHAGDALCLVQHDAGVTPVLRDTVSFFRIQHGCGSYIGERSRAVSDTDGMAAACQEKQEVPLPILLQIKELLSPWLSRLLCRGEELIFGSKQCFGCSCASEY